MSHFIETLLPYVCGRILLLVQLPPVVCALVQLQIFSVQFLQIVLTNAIILESRRVLGFERFLLHNKKRNPYDEGIIANIADFTQPAGESHFQGLRPGEITDAYCEAMLKNRGLNLRPTIHEQ
jgi:hypothetical protein